MHPHYNYPQCYDLSIDPKEVINLNYSDLKKDIKKNLGF